MTFLALLSHACLHLFNSQGSILGKMCKEIPYCGLGGAETVHCSFDTPNNWCYDLHILLLFCIHCNPSMSLFVCLFEENVIARSYTLAFILWTKIAMRCSVLNFLCVIGCMLIELYLLWYWLNKHSKDMGNDWAFLRMACACMCVGAREHQNNYFVLLFMHSFQSHCICAMITF